MTIDESLEWLISRKEHYEMDDNCQELAQALEVAIDTMRKYQQLEDFARWVAVEVIDEELWTYNHLAFAEIACRKLVKLGIMQESDGEYTYELRLGREGCVR